MGGSYCEEQPQIKLLAVCQPTVSRLTADCWPFVGCLPVNYPLTVVWQTANKKPWVPHLLFKIIHSPSVTVSGRYPTSFASTGTTIPALWKVLLTTFLFLALMPAVLVSRLYFSSFALDRSEAWRVFSDFCLGLPPGVFMKSSRNLLNRWKCCTNETSHTSVNM